MNQGANPKASYVSPNVGGPGLLPFTSAQFLAVFVEYNAAIWPIQVVAYLLGLAAALLVLVRKPVSDRIVGIILSAMWLWTGIGYHLLFFSAVNKAAYGFGAAFILQGAALAYAAGWRNWVCFGVPSGPTAWVGAAFVVYAAIVYPLIGLWTGHAYPAMPMFGVTPCPVTIFTFGMLLLTVQPVPRLLLAIPLVWSLIGGSAAVLLNVAQDWVLLVSGLIAIPLLLWRDRITAPMRIS